ncbi:alpha/beta fold hydrolase [Sinimarinibacterium sp. NLF-5-8]|uniref:alpha/beta fold hydrolase n=1 Tax=Sinimarinibacterium sp. NLF-5-8 TaxID=2698684 RepID=UPI00137C1D4B|nr:alpha/beta hydrolase [Sinimarinibacterium sp. NLF-5-8]QHS10645.1 alpha/beta hydrolase [Sinimarinibacterium sp. NLF-5-8]
MNFKRWHDTGQFFDFHGHAIFHQRHGSDATALLVLHGYPTASWDFVHLWPALCSRFAHVIAPDLLGFGYSAKPRAHDYSLMEQADLCEALLAHCGVIQVHLLVHDYSVSIAQELLARQLERGTPQIQSVIFLNGALFPESHRATALQKLMKSPLGPLCSFMFTERHFIAPFKRIFGARSQPTPIELHDFWQLIRHNDGHFALPHLLHYIDDRRQYRARWVGALQSTRVPMRLINGPDDPVSGAHMAQRYRELVPEADVISLPGIGHYPQVEAPDRVLRHLADFYRNNRLPA